MFEKACVVCKICDQTMADTSKMQLARLKHLFMCFPVITQNLFRDSRTKLRFIVFSETRSEGNFFLQMDTTVYLVN